MAHYTVLVVDYEPRSIAHITKPLREAGYHVEVAQDGLTALKRFAELKPDLVLIEAMIPKKHGFEVCQEIKRSPEGRHVPVIITTGVYRGRKYRSQAFHVYGADEYLEKPFSAEALLQTCQRFLGNGHEPERRDAAASAAAASEGQGVAAAAPAAAEAPAGLDLSEQEIMARLDAVFSAGSAPEAAAAGSDPPPPSASAAAPDTAPAEAPPPHPVLFGLPEEDAPEAPGEPPAASEEATAVETPLERPAPPEQPLMELLDARSAEAPGPAVEEPGAEPSAEPPVSAEASAGVAPPAEDAAESAPGGGYGDEPAAALRAEFDEVEGPTALELEPPTQGDEAEAAVETEVVEPVAEPVESLEPFEGREVEPESGPLGTELPSWKELDENLSEALIGEGSDAETPSPEDVAVVESAEPAEEPGDEAAPLPAEAETEELLEEAAAGEQEREEAEAGFLEASGAVDEASPQDAAGEPIQSTREGLLETTEALAGADLETEESAGLETEAEEEEGQAEGKPEFTPVAGMLETAEATQAPVEGSQAANEPVAEAEVLVQPRSSQPAVWIGVAAGLLAGLALAGWLLLGRGSPAEAEPTRTRVIPSVPAPKPASTEAASGRVEPGAGAAGTAAAQEPSEVARAGEPEPVTGALARKAAPVAAREEERSARPTEPAVREAASAEPRPTAPPPWPAPRPAAVAAPQPEPIATEPSTPAGAGSATGGLTREATEDQQAVEVLAAGGGGERTRELEQTEPPAEATAPAAIPEVEPPVEPPVEVAARGEPVRPADTAGGASESPRVSLGVEEALARPGPGESSEPQEAEPEAAAAPPAPGEARARPGNDRAWQPAPAPSAASAPAAAEAPAPRLTPGELVPLEEVDVPPQPISRPLPEYPPLALRARHTGTVYMRLLINERGEVERVEIVQPTRYPELNEAAERAAERWRFTPARKDRVPVRVWKPEKIVFQL